MKISSLFYQIDDLESLITNCQVKLKMIDTSEYRRKKILDVLSKINIKCYTFEYTTIESSKGGSLIESNIRYKVRNDLKIESTLK